MTLSRSLLLAAALSAISALTLAGCAGPAGRVTATSAPAAAPVALKAATAVANCSDGWAPDVSIKPVAKGTDPAAFAADSETIKAIKARGYLKVATNGDVLGWGATDTRTGEPKGYDVDLAAAIARALGVDPAHTEYTVIPYSRRLKVLAAGEVDLVAQQMTITCARWTGVAATTSSVAAPAINLSIPYYTAGAKVLVRSDSTVRQVSDLKGQPVCGTTGSTSLAAIAQLGIAPVEAASAGQCLVKFEEGEVAAVVGDETTLAGFTRQDPSSAILRMDPINPGQYGLGTPAKDPVFTGYVNAVLEKLRADGTLTTLYDRWMKPLVGGTAPGLPALNAGSYGRARGSDNALAPKS